MNWTWFHKLGSPKWFYGISGKLLPWLSIAALLLIGVGVVWGLAFAPPDYQQGNSFRIIYIHVPAAMLAQSCYVMLAVCGVVGLVWKMKLADVALQCAAPIGAWMTAVALVTGAIWGKPTWGSWWVWDARLTSMLILLFLYFGLIALGNAISNRDSAAKACAVLAIVGVINIPIIKYSVEWWNTLHQGATFTLTEKPAMPAEMWLPLLTVLGFYCFFGAVLLLRMRLEVLKREARASWVKAEVQNSLEARDEFCFIRRLSRHGPPWPVCLVSLWHLPGGAGLNVARRSWPASAICNKRRVVCAGRTASESAAQKASDHHSRRSWSVSALPSAWPERPAAEHQPVLHADPDRQRRSAADTRIRAGGMVEKGSLQRSRLAGRQIRRHRLQQSP
jgi:heme exporter protein C